MKSCGLILSSQYKMSGKKEAYLKVVHFDWLVQNLPSHFDKVVDCPSFHTLGARGFSCAVSGVGHVFIVTRAAKAKRRISVRRAREKTPGTQGIFFISLH